MKRVVCAIMAGILLLAGQTAVPAAEKTLLGITAVPGENDSYSAMKAEAANPEYTFQTVNGGTVSSLSDGTKDVTVLIFGRISCGNSASTIQNIAQSGWVHNPKVRVIFVEMNKASLEEVKEFADLYGCEDITFCYDTGSGGVGAMWHYLSMAGISSSVTLPGTVLIDGQNNVQNIFTGYQSSYSIYLAMNQFTNVGGEGGQEDALRDIAVEGREDYDAVNRVLALVNETRAAEGAPALALDASLCEAAMLRAAEISLFYSHTRPNGQDCSSLLRKSSAYGENIALYAMDADMVMANWNRSPGHHANIVSTAYTSIGIGCFIDGDGSRCWVQCFDNAAATAPVRSGIVPVTRTISVWQSMIDLQTTEKSEIRCGDTQAAVQMDVRNSNREWSYCRTKLSAANFDFSSSNPGVAEVSEGGVITVKAVGTAVITASLKQNPAIKVSRTVAKKAHSYRDTVVAPTNTSQGYTLHTCTSCGDSYRDTYMPILTQPSGSEPGNGASGSEPGNGTSGSGSGSGTSGNEPGSGTTGSSESGSASGNRPGDTQTVGNQTGSQKFELQSAQITLSYTSTVYSGKEKRPSVKVVDRHGQFLGSEHYTVQYSNNSNVGQAAVKVLLRGSYAGSLSKTFTIVPKGTAISKVTAGKKGFTVKWKKQKVQTSGYEVAYSTSRRFAKKASGTAVIKKSGVSSTKVKRLKAKKAYYVRIRTYKTVRINGVSTKLYSGWSAIKQVKTK